MINRNNYEIFLIDYMDGNLTADQVAELLLFLENHPDIASEFEGVSELHVPVAKEVFGNKSSLKKDEIPMSSEELDYLLVKKLEGDLSPDESLLIDELLATYAEVQAAWKLFQNTQLKPEVGAYKHQGELIVLTDEEILSEEELLVAELEGDLTGEQKEELDLKLGSSESLRLMKRLISATVVQADNSIDFPNKKFLKKTPVIRLYTRIGSAIATAAAVALFFILNTGNEGTGISIANHEVHIGNKNIADHPAVDIVVLEVQDENNREVEDEPHRTIPEQELDKPARTYQATFAHLPHKNSPTLLQTEPAIAALVVSKGEIIHYELEEPIADINSSGKFPTVRELIGDKVKQGLWGGEDYPEEGYTLALLGKAADKLNNRSGSDVEIGNEEKEGGKFFVRIGKFSVSK